MTNSEGGLELAGPEVDALAWYVASRQLADVNQDDWLQWENLPSLSETTFNELCDAVNDISHKLLERMRWLETDHCIDARDIHSRASA